MNMHVYLKNLLQLRAEKMTPSVNPCDDLRTANTIETITILEDVPIHMVQECCSVLAFFIRLQHGFTSVDFATENDLTETQRTQLHTMLHGVETFEQYMHICRSMIENVLENGKRVYALLSSRRQQEQNKHCVENANENSSATEEYCDDEEEDEVKSMHTLLHNMDTVFLRFYDLFVNGDCFPEAIVREKLFISRSLSLREPFLVRRENLDNLNSLFSTLTQAIIASTDRCNTMFEAFFGTGILFTVLLNLITNKYVLDYLDNNTEKQNTNIAEYGTNGNTGNPNNSNQRIRHWTRVRLLNPDDRNSIHFLKDTTTEAYARTIRRLPVELFDATSGLDVYLSKGDTLSTLFIQFVGRIYLRLYEWIERDDVREYILKHYICQNIQTLFMQIGRGQDQRAWIRFFKRTHDRRAKIYIKLEPLLQLNDEIIAGNNEDRANHVAQKNAANLLLQGTAMTTTSSSGSIANETTSLLQASTQIPQVRKTTSAETSRRYHTFRNFIERYNNFIETRNGAHLREHWEHLRSSFLQIGGIKLASENASSSLRSFEAWCTNVNSAIFPYNFLLSALDEDAHQKHRQTQQTFNQETLDLAWTLKCQEYLLSNNFTSSKCKQILNFLKNLEIKSRLLIEEKNFLYIFSSGMENMPFLYELFGEALESMEDPTKTTTTRQNDDREYTIHDFTNFSNNTTDKANNTATTGTTATTTITTLTKPSVTKNMTHTIATGHSNDNNDNSDNPSSSSSSPFLPSDTPDNNVTTIMPPPIQLTTSMTNNDNYGEPMDED